VLFPNRGFEGDSPSATGGGDGRSIRVVLGLDGECDEDCSGLGDGKEVDMGRGFGCEANDCDLTILGS
jgi:hypothetical protein